MTTPPRRPALPGILLALALLPGLLACGVRERLQQTPAGRPPPEVPRELRMVWEVWHLLDQDFGGREEIDSRRLSEGAVQGMVQALGEHDPPYLTPRDYDVTQPGLGAVWQAWRVLETRLPATPPLDLPGVQEAAIQGMLKALDNPYTFYLSPSQYEVEASSFSSSFEGIGAYVNVRDEQVFIVAPMPGSPAERAGLLPGDIVLAVNGVPTRGLSLIEVTLRIRGPRGSAVELRVLHPGRSEAETVTVLRDVIKHPSVRWEPLSDSIAYLWVGEFLDTTDEEVAEALQAIGAQGFQGLVLDLRRNPGGLLSSTVAVASQFLKEGPVLYQVDGHGKRTDLAVQQGGKATGIPLAVLVDRGTASGSEVVAGALQDYRRATLIGTRTFGKGSVNQLRMLSDGSGLYLTIALWYTPDGSLIEGAGLQPDVAVPMDLRVPLGSVLDVQLARAVEQLRTQSVAAAR